MDDPNLDDRDKREGPGRLIAPALVFTSGRWSEIPYHVLLPAWMLENVRRGSELVGGQAEPRQTSRSPSCNGEEMARR